MGWRSALKSIDPTTDEGLTNLATGGSYGIAKDASSTLDDLGRKFDDKVLGGDAADAAEAAAATQAEAQQAALDYLKETEALPQAFREGALTQLGAYYGIGIDPETGGFTQIEATGPSQEQMLSDAQSSPLYDAIMGGREAGEEARARRAAAGSGLRGGATTSTLIDYNTDLKNQATLQAFNQQQQQQQQRLAGLGQLSQLPSMAPQIAQGTANIGQTLAQGQIAGANAQQQAYGNVLGGATTLAAAAISDERLKEDIAKIKVTPHPYIYEYEWNWNPKAEAMGKQGKERGFIAQEVEQVWPDLVIHGDDGYKRILKDKIEKRLEDMKNG